MRLLVSGCTVSAARLMKDRPDRLGVLLTPSNGNREWWGPRVCWAADNDCFRGLDPPAYMRMLARVLAFRTRPAWVVLPDVVADAEGTWALAAVWLPLLKSLGLPAALVLQDGQERLRRRAYLDAHWGDLAAVFVGGTTGWKLSDHAAALTLEARRRGKLVHWGRVNTARRIRWLGRGMRDGRLWCDTFDGTGFSAYGDKRIPSAVRWIDAALADRQGVLFGGTA